MKCFCFPSLQPAAMMGAQIQWSTGRKELGREGEVLYFLSISINTYNFCRPGIYTNLSETHIQWLQTLILFALIPRKTCGLSVEEVGIVCFRAQLTLNIVRVSSFYSCFSCLICQIEKRLPLLLHNLSELIWGINDIS